MAREEKRARESPNGRRSSRRRISLHPAEEMGGRERETFVSKRNVATLLENDEYTVSKFALPRRKA